MDEFKKQPESVLNVVDKMVKTLLTDTKDKGQKAQLILFDIIQHMTKGSYIFAKLKGIARDLARDNATYTIKERFVNCKDGCKGCPHGPYFYLYYRVQQKQNSRYLGPPLWWSTPKPKKKR